MKHEEEKLKQKYPNMKAGVGGSALLSKRLQKVGKYAESIGYPVDVSSLCTVYL